MKLISKLSLIAGVVLSSSAFADDDNPGSLWPSKFHNPMVDRTACKPGDIITILISESSDASFTASTKTSRDEQAAIGNPNIPIIAGLFKSLGLNNSSSYKGDGTTTQSGTLTAKMSAIVKKVLPNGNMIIEGTRSVRVNKDTRIITLTGTIRKDDIAADNSIRSELIANAEIKNDGMGQISDKQKRGILARILEWLF